MQGQRSTIGSLPDSLNFDYESPPTNAGIDQQICWNNLRNSAESRLPDYRIPATNSDTTYVSQEGRNLDERLAQTGWSPPINTSFGVGLRLDVQQHDHANLTPESGVNLNIGNNQTVTGPSFVRGSSSGSGSHNFDLNVARFHRAVDEMDRPNSSKPIGFESRFHPLAGTSSADPFASGSSNNNRLLVEDDDGRPDFSLDGRRLSCKRKTLEGNVGQSSSSGNPFVGEEETTIPAISPTFELGSRVNINALPDNSSNVNNNFPEPVNPGLGLGLNGRVNSNNVGQLNLAGRIENSSRIHRSRVNLSIQPDSSMSNNSFLHPIAPSVHQNLRFVPVDPPLDLMSQNRSNLSRVPTMRRNMQSQSHSHRWSSQRPGSSSGPSVLPDDSSSRNMPRNIGEHPMFSPPVDATRNSASHPTNWSLSGSRSSEAPHNLSSSHPRHPPSHYSRRISEYVRRSLMAVDGSDTAGQSSGNNSLPVSLEDSVLPSIGVVPGLHRPHSSRSALRLERQGDGAGGISYLRGLAAAGEGRSRLVSEIRNALDIIRRGEGLRVEDVMLLDQSVFFGMADIHDQHREMRLDVDNMSYEELLALEERIGYVCTGLTEETILKCMKHRKHVHIMTDEVTFAEPCCVCQEQYKDGEDIGTLDCGHDFHRDCVKQWLLLKNICPICKTTGLAT